MNLFDVLFAKKLGGGSPFPPVIKRVTGNPIEFTDGADAPLVKCTTAIQGNQDLHGYDKPWVGGAGKNKLPLVLADIKSANTSGTWSGNSYTCNGVTFTVNTDEDGNVISISTANTSNAQTDFIVRWHQVYASGDYILSGCPAGGSTSTYWVTTGIALDDVGGGKQFTSDGSTQYTTKIMCRANVNMDELTFYPMIRLSTETDPTFAPYSNICPITAYDESTISGVGRNKFQNLDPATVSTARCTFSLSGNTYTMVCSGNDAQIGNYPAVGSEYVSSSGTKQRCTVGESIKIVPSNTAINKNYVAFYDDEDKVISRLRCNLDAFTVPEGAKYYTLRLGIEASGTNTYTFTVMVLKSTDTDTTFEPYVMTTHTATFSQSIYQGNADFVGGVLTKDWVLYEPSEVLNVRTEGEVVYWIVTASLTGYNSANYIISSHFKAEVALTPGNCYITLNGTQLIIVPPDQTLNTIALANEWITNNKPQFAYKLRPAATTVTEDITPTNLPLKSLFGYNHIESSTGEMVVDYITDAYQNFVDTVESALPSNTRNLLTASKGGVKAFDIFKTLDEPKTPEAPAEESGPEEEKEIEEGAKK